MAKKKTAKKTAGKKTVPAKKASKPAKKPTKKMASKKGDPADLITMILEDHKPLKELIRVLKNSDDHDFSERQEAFEKFCPLLVSHAKPEEQTMYVFMKADDELREGGFEGDVEHQLADQMIEEAKRTDDQDLWSARVKVLAELVEHHIKEEEEDMLPDFRKHSEKEQRAELGASYMRLKTALEAKGGEDSPSEKMMKNQKPPGKNTEPRTEIR